MMKLASCRIGLWTANKLANGTIRVDFKYPSSKRLLVEALIRYLLAIIYISFCARAIFWTTPAIDDSFALFCIMLSPLFLAAYLRTTNDGDNRFIAYILEIDQRAKQIKFIDPRASYEETHYAAFKEIDDVYIHQNLNSYRQSLWVAMRCKDGRIFNLPWTGPVSEDALNLIRELITPAH